MCTEGAWWGSDSTLDTDDSYRHDKISFYKKTEGRHVMNTNMNKSSSSSYSTTALSVWPWLPYGF